MAHQEEEHETTIQGKVQYPLDSNSYKIVDEIGVGISGTVYKAICLPKKSEVAIKAIDLDKARSDFDNVRLEAKTMSLLSHPNILSAHCSFTVENRLWVVMPFMAAGSLESIMSSLFTEGLPELCIAVILKEILNALSYLHNQGHIHRDIKAGNILMDSNGSVKLADFGVSASIYESSINSSRSGWLSDIAGTPYWMAPEVILQSNNDGFKADIWSFGITALELAYGRPPLSHLTFSKSLLLKITKRFRFSDVYEKQNEAKKKKKKKKFSESFKNMVASCLNQDPSKRPTSEKLLKCSFFKNCKLGSDFLVKNMLVGLQRVEERFKDSYNEGKEITTTEENVKTRRISGWNFNEDRFELQPIFPSELLLDKKVTFGSESIIQYRGSNESDESNTSAPSQTDEVIRQLNQSEVIEEESNIEEVIEQTSGSIAEAVENSGIDREHMLRNLRAITNSLEIQKREAMKLIYNLGGEGMDINREQVMAQVIETLKMDLEREKMKKVEMEYELEFLKLQISNISSAGGRDSN